MYVASETALVRRHIADMLRAAGIESDYFMVGGLTGGRALPPGGWGERSCRTERFCRCYSCRMKASAPAWGALVCRCRRREVLLTARGVSSYFLGWP